MPRLDSARPIVQSIHTVCSLRCAPKYLSNYSDLHQTQDKTYQQRTKTYLANINIVDFPVAVGVGLCGVTNLADRYWTQGMATSRSVLQQEPSIFDTKQAADPTRTRPKSPGLPFALPYGDPDRNPPPPVF